MTHPRIIPAPDHMADPMFSERLCATIKQYWKIRGVKVAVWIEAVSVKPYADQKARPVFQIKSENIPVRGA